MSNFREAITETSLNKLLNSISNLVIVDVGVIKSVSNGRATISSLVRNGKTSTVYKNIELLYIGSNSCRIDVATTGCYCLLFIPRTSTYELANYDNSIYPPYNTCGMKALSITTSKIGPQASSLFFDDRGGISYISQGPCVVSADPESISINVKRAYETASDVIDVTDISQSIDINNPYTFSYTKNNLSQQLMITSTGDISFTQTNIDTDTKIRDVKINVNGSTELQHKDKSITINEDDSVNIQWGEGTNIQISSDGNININAPQINLNGDTKSLVTFTELQTALATYFDKLNVAIASGIADKAYVAPAAFNMNDAEANTIKTK